MKIGNHLFFSLFSVFLHIFFVAILLLLFINHQPASHLIQQSESKIIVYLRSAKLEEPSFAQTLPTPLLQRAPLESSSTQIPVISPSVENQQPSETVVRDVVINDPACSTLPKKPERIFVGENYIQMSANVRDPGSIVLKMVINSDGSVQKVDVIKTTMNKNLEEQVIAWAYRATYLPGEIDGVAVACVMTYEIAPKFNVENHD